MIILGSSDIPILPLLQGVGGGDPPIKCMFHTNSKTSSQKSQQIMALLLDPSDASNGI